METIKRSEAKLGQHRFWYLAGPVVALQAAVAVLLFATWGRDLLPNSVWLHLLALVVGLLGTARGSNPVRYLLVFFLAAGAIQNILFMVALGPLSGTSLILTIDIILGINVLLSGAFGVFLLSSKKFMAWFHLQQARNFGLRVRMEENSNPNPASDGKAEAQGYRQDLENDELGVFDEE